MFPFLVGRSELLIKESAGVIVHHHYSKVATAHVQKTIRQISDETLFNLDVQGSVT